MTAGKVTKKSSKNTHSALDKEGGGDEDEMQ